MKHCSERSEHTPGPWEYTPNDGHNRHIYAADGSSLMCDETYYPWCPDNEADWILIAAAPELLEALLRLTGMIRDCHNVYQNHGASWMLKQESFSLAEAAISKASGTEPPPRG